MILYSYFSFNHFCCRYNFGLIGKQIILTDTPGNQKYLKQTLAATTLAVDYALLVVDFNMIGQSEYIAEICKCLLIIQNNFMNKRVLVVVNKSEKSKNELKKSTLQQLLSEYKSLEVSCVTGRNLQYLKKILFSLPKQRSNHLVSTVCNTDLHLTLSFYNYATDIIINAMILSRVLVRFRIRVMRPLSF